MPAPFSAVDAGYLVMRREKTPVPAPAGKPADMVRILEDGKVRSIPKAEAIALAVAGKSPFVERAYSREILAAAQGIVDARETLFRMERRRAEETERRRRAEEARERREAERDAEIRRALEAGRGIRIFPDPSFIPPTPPEIRQPQRPAKPAPDPERERRRRSEILQKQRDDARERREQERLAARRAALRAKPARDFSTVAILEVMRDEIARFNDLDREGREVCRILTSRLPSLEDYDLWLKEW